MSYEQKVDPRPPEQWSAGAHSRPTETELTEKAEKLLEDVRIGLEHDLTAALRATGHLAALLCRNIREMPRPAAARGGLAPWQENKVKDYIERRMGATVRVEDLARLVSLSSGHFCRGFKQSFGDTPHAYITRTRLDRARELMLTTPQPLSQIALASGHSDQAHFTKRFRQVTGETPHAWRRRRAMGDWAMASRQTGSPAPVGLGAELAWTATDG